MKIAIQLSGQPRFTYDFDLFLKNLTGYDQADWFVYLTNNNTQVEKSEISMPSSWVKFDLEWAANKLKSNLPVNNYLRSFEISDAYDKSWPPVKNLHCCMSVDRAFMMYYNIFKANQLRITYQETHNITYDLVVRVRADSDLDSVVNLKELSIARDEIIMPSNNWFGDDPKGVITNDQFAISQPSAMDTYSNLVNLIKKYNDEGIQFHPESLLAYHLKFSNIKTTKGTFQSNIRKLPINLEKWN